MAASMKAGTAVTVNLYPAPVTALYGRNFPNFNKKPSLFSGASLTNTRTSNFRIRNVSQPPSQGDVYGSNDGVSVIPASVISFAKGLVDFSLSNFLPLALVGGVALGFKSPELGCLAHKYSMSRVITCWLFFLSGLKLQDGDFKDVVDAWPALLYGLVAILILSPLLSKMILNLQMVPQEFITGIAIFNCMPTTMNGGVALTQLVGGNSALALALTVISVLSGILTVPLWITKFFADGYGVSIPTRQLFQNLILILLVPLIIGKTLRNIFPALGKFVEQNRKFFSFTTSVLIGFFPWMQVSMSRQLLLMVKPAVFVRAISLGIAVHLTLLTLNTLFVKSLALVSPSWKSIFDKEGNRRALTLVCSQRSVLISTAVVEQLGGLLGEAGLLLLPCVAGDVNQIIIDSLLVNFWLGKDESRDMVKAKEA